MGNENKNGKHPKILHMEDAAARAILEENRRYWTWRAQGYSEINREELSTAQRRRWAAFLRQEIRMHFPNRRMSELRALDVGTGPGFFAILLCGLGCDVTAVDLTPAMLEKAGENAGPLAGRICFREMNAEALSFEDESFDLVVSRNLTWNLPHPDRAYAEWTRVLAPGGLLMNFDANWYAYLFDEASRRAYEEDRRVSADLGIPDRNVGENFDVMEEIARRIPLSGVRRPFWDLRILRSLGVSAAADELVWQKVWSDAEKANFASTPLFLVRAVPQKAGSSAAI